MRTAIYKHALSLEGEPVQVINFLENGSVICLFEGGYPHCVSVENLSNVEPIDWEQRHFELVKAAMYGIISNGVPTGIATSRSDYASHVALEYADEMIKKLKGE